MSKHTPGPWVVGNSISQHLEHGEDMCGFFEQGLPLLSTGSTKTANPRRFQDAYHQHLWLPDGELSYPSFRSIIAMDGTLVVGMYDYEDGGVCTGEADARLIAAAPELLEALKYIVAWSPDGDKWNAERARDMARAAIAKAEGQKGAQR